MRSPLRHVLLAAVVVPILAGPVRGRASSGRDGPAVRRGAPLVYVALGASGEEAGAARAGDPALVAARLARRGADVRLVDLTAPGATIHDLVTRQLAKVLALRPALVTVAVARGDVARTSLRRFSRDVQILADALFRNRAHVVFASLPPAERLRPGARPAARERIDAFDFAIRRIARRHRFSVAEPRGAGAGVGRSWVDAVGSAAERAVAAPSPTSPVSPPRMAGRTRARTPEGT